MAASFTLATVAAAFVGIQQSAAQRLKYLSLFHDQFIRIEPPALLLIAGFAIAVYVLARRSQPTEPDAPRPLLWTRRPTRYPAIALAAAAALVSIAGIWLVFQNYLFIDDEYSGWFQSLIFAHGKWSTVIPEGWCRVAPAITPTSISSANCQWHLSYLPIHSLIRGAFLALHADWLTEPLLTLASVLLVIAIARRLWPERPDRAWIAGALLASSTQVLFMSMTGFAMPAHLFFALLWLWLYVRDTTVSLLLLPWIGALALGVHSPLPHVFWAPIFFVRYVRERRWAVLGYCAVVYVTAMSFWTAQLGLSSSGVVASGGDVVTAARGIVHSPTLGHFRDQAMQLALVFTWSSPITGVALVASLTLWKRLDVVCRYLALSLLMVLAARVFSTNSQGAGWGYRYAYVALGNIVLLAACGVDAIAAAIGARGTRMLFAASLALTVVIQLPMRAVQVNDVIAPYRRASRWLESRPEPIVVFPGDQVLWGRTLLRNDPFFERGPLLVSRPDLARDALPQLQAAFPGRVRVVTLQEMVGLGLVRTPLISGNSLIIFEQR